MEDQPRPAPNRWRKAGAVGATWRMPVPPEPPPEPTKAEREQEAHAEARTEARVTRLHLTGLPGGGVIVMGLALAAVVVLAVLALIGHH
jgi:hypothetical protein